MSTTQDDDLPRLIEAHDRIRDFAASLSGEGFTAPLIVDGLMAAGINAAVLVAGREATARCLMEWATKVRDGWSETRPQPGEKTH